MYVDDFGVVRRAVFERTFKMALHLHYYVFCPNITYIVIHFPAYLKIHSRVSTSIENCSFAANLIVKTKWRLEFSFENCQ